MLKVKEDSPGRLVFQSSMVPSLGNLFSMLIWVGVLILFFLPGLGEGQVDFANLAMILFFFAVTVGGSALAGLTSTVVTLDRSSRSLTLARRLLGFPLRSTSLSFGDIENIHYEYYRQSSGRYSHDAWRIVAVAKDGQRALLNWDGKKEEMATLAQKVASITGVELVDNSAKPVSNVQQILDTIRGPLGGTPDNTAPAGDAAMPSPPNRDEQAGAGIPDATIPTIAAPWANPADTASQMPSTVESAVPSETDYVSDVTPSGARVSAASLRTSSVQELEKRVAGDPLDSDARYALGRKYHDSGQLDRAIGLYQELLRLDPTNAAAQNDLGVALQQRGKRAEAEAAFRRAAALDPFSSTAHLNLGLLLRSAKRATEASQEFYLARQNARSADETRAAEAASTGANMRPVLSA